MQWPCQHKAKRDKAIMEQHEKGHSTRKIAEMFGMGQSTVSEAILEVAGNGDSPKSATPQETPQFCPLKKLTLYPPISNPFRP